MIRYIVKVVLIMVLINVITLALVSFVMWEIQLFNFSNWESGARAVYIAWMWIAAIIVLTWR